MPPTPSPTYERLRDTIAKRMHGITRCEKGTYALVGGDELSDSERDELLQLCRHRTPISSSIKVPGSPMRQGPLRVLRGP